MSNFSVELRLRVYDDTEGSCVEVREDQDGCGLVEIIPMDANEKKEDFMPMMTTEQARILANAIIKLCDELDSKE